jgi:hypothetical protein
LAKKFKPEVAENPKTIVLEQASAAKPFSPTATVVR